MHTTLAVFAALTIMLHAVGTPPPGGGDLVDAAARVSARVNGGNSAVHIRVSNSPFTEATRVTVIHPSPDQPWDTSLAVPIISKTVKKNDRLLVSYMARCASGGSGRVTAKLQFSSPPYTSAGMTDAAMPGDTWEQINQPFIASTDIPEGKGELILMLGDQKQSTEIAAIRVLNYGPDFDLTKLPRQKSTYEGREVTAPWRGKALARIEKIRMADYSMQVIGADGKPLANTPVTVFLHRHAFGFGTCVTRGMLTVEGSDGERYREIVKRTCSRVVFENDLKPDTFPDDEKGRDQLDDSFRWLKTNDISIRGHYLIQEAVDGWTHSRLGDPEKLRKTYMESIRERIAFVGDRVTEWDAVNHPIGWGGAELLGEKGGPLAALSMDVFHEARRLTSLPICINEDQLFRPGPQQDKTYELLAKLKRDGVRVDGLGNQAHFNSSFLPSPEELLRVTHRFAAVVPKQVITEYDVVTNGDEQLAADYLRDSLIACFSHSAYDGFLLWGFWEGSHWIPEAALWKKDWTIKAAGKIWEEWVGKRWQTRKTLTTNANGEIAWRGFKGVYQLEVSDRTTGAFQPGDAKSPGKIHIP